MYLFCFSAIANKHVLKAMSRLGAGSFEYFDSHAKSKWENKVVNKLIKEAFFYVTIFMFEEEFYVFFKWDLFKVLFD